MYTSQVQSDFLLLFSFYLHITKCKIWNVIHIQKSKEVEPMNSGQACGKKELVK